MPTTARVTGSVTIRLNETNGAYGVASQAVSLIINGGSTTTISLQAQSSGTANWSAASTWGSGGLVSILFDNSFAPIDYTNNVLDTPSLLSWQYAASGNPLSSSGPSDGTFVINNILSTTGTTPFGFPLVYSASMALLYDVTVPDATQVAVDQAGVRIDSLTIGATGTVSAATGAFTVENGVTGGLLQAINSGTVYLSGNVVDVTLAGSGGGLLALYSAVLTDIMLSTGTVQVASGQSATLDGTIANTGSIQILGAASVAGFAEIQVGTATLTGGGVIALDGPGDNRLNASSILPAATLVNQGNTIEGQGTVGNIHFSFANHGLVASTDSGKTLRVVTTGTLDNSAGTLQAAAGAYLDLVGTAIAGGAIQAGDQGTVFLEQAVSDATLMSTGAGVFTAYSGTLANDTIGSGAQLQIASGHMAQLNGTLFNQGAVALLGSAAPNGLAELQITGTATLSGGGAIALDGPGNSLIDDDGAAATLINLDNVIRGSGTVGGANLTLSNQGTISANISGQALTLGTLTNAGTVGASGGGALIVGGLIGSGSVSVGASGGLEVQGTLGAQSIVLSGANAHLQWDNPAATTATLFVEPGETIDLRNVVPGSVSYNGGTLNYTPLGGSAASMSMTLQGGATGVSITGDGQGGTEVLTLCFCANTRIATPRGEVRVEDLAEGDLVLTHSGEAKPIVWLGRGRVLATRGRRSAATPVTIRKGALADNVPHHDLRVTKGHSFYLDGVLIPAEFLVNHRSILWDDRAQEVSVYHVELAGHDVLLANGAPAESYRDDGNRWLFQNRNMGWYMPPQTPCAPVLTGGPIVDAVWGRLLQRAGSRPGFTLTGDPDLHLLVDGRRLDSRSRFAGGYVFRLERAPCTVSIASRAASPDELGIARDPRALGVAVRRVLLHRGRQCRVLESSDPLLRDGFHGYEADPALRWTNGAGMLPQWLFAGFVPPMHLVVYLAGATQYPLLPEARDAA